MRLPRHVHRILVILLIGGLANSGCTHSVRQTVGQYSPGLIPTTQPAPASAVYSIKILDSSGKKIRSVDFTRCYLNRGDTIGFTVDEGGTVFGVAGTYSFPIEIQPEHSVVWSGRFRRPTQFANEVGKGWDTTTKIIVIIGFAGLIGGAAWGWYQENRDNFRLK